MFVVRPYFRQWTPPEFSATLPPTGTGDLARRVGGVVEAFVLDRLGNAEIGDPGLGDDAAIVVVDFEDAVEFAETENDPISERQGATGERRAGAAWHDLDALIVTIAEDRRHLVRRFRQDDDERQLAVGRQAIALVRAQSLGFDDHTVVGNDPAHHLGNLGSPREDIRIRFRHAHDRGLRFLPAAAHSKPYARPHKSKTAPVARSGPQKQNHAGGMVIEGVLWMTTRAAV